MVIPAGVNLSNEFNGLVRPTPETASIDKIALSRLASNLPVGGTTGLCHQSSASIEQAAAWYRDNRDTAERPLIPALRRRFGLTAHEAVMALREANV